MKATSSPEAFSSFSSEAVHAFMEVLHRCLATPGGAHGAARDLSPYFDPATRTLSAPRLLCSGLTDQDLATFHVLEHVHGDLLLRDNPELTTLDGLRNLKTVSGRLELINSGIRALYGLTRLARCRALLVDTMPNLTAISGVTALEDCRDGLSICNAPLLERITGFSSLTRIDNGPLVIRDCPCLASGCGLTALTSVRNGVIVSNCPELTDFRFLAALASVPSIEVNNTGLADGTPLRNLFAANPHFKGAVKFTRNRDLADLSFMQGLTTVRSSLYLDRNNLGNLRGLEGLRRVGGSLNLAGNKLTDISQLARLEEIDGILLLSANRLTSLHGLEKLRRIRSKEWGQELMSIKINDNRDAEGRLCLTDIGALANVSEVTNRLVIYTDSGQGHRYRVRPGADSIFSTRNANFQVFGRGRATRLPLAHIIALPEQVPVPLLFPDMSKAWLDNLRQCHGIVPHFLPFADVANLVALCRAHTISVVVGIKLTSQKFLAAHRDELRHHGLRFIVNDEQTLNNCENKHDFKQFMDGNGFGDYVPAYYDRPETIRYPCIVKPHHGSFGSGQRIVSAPHELGRLGNNEVVCEFIPGPVEYATHCFFLDRHTFHHVTYKKTYNRPYFILGTEDKANLLYETVATPFPELLLALLEKMRFRGICCIDYKPLGNIPKIFEINARIGFTLSAHAHDLKKMLDLYMAHAQ